MHFDQVTVNGVNSNIISIPDGRKQVYPWNQKNIELITKMVIDAINQSEDKGNGFMVPIGVSARHVHLTQEHVETLFGPGYQLTKKKDLMGGQFASNETVQSLV